MNAKKVGSFIKEQRQELGLSQKELAEKLYITDKAVSKWETGRGLPDISSLEPLSNALNVSVSEILNGEKSQYIERTAENEVQRYIIKKGTPAKTIGIQLMPEYYDYYLKKEFNIGYSVFEEMLHCNTREMCIPSLSAVFHQLLGFRGDDISSTIFYREKIDEAVSLLFQNAKRAKSGAAISKTDYRSIINIVEYMAQNVDIALSLGEMAECAYMSPAKFKYTFQSVMGHSFSEHFFLLRMAKACDLLLNSNEYITAIAQSVGYKNVGSFSTQFKRYAGILPSEYRATKVR